MSLPIGFSRKSHRGETSQRYPSQFAIKKLTFICILIQILNISKLIYINLDNRVPIMSDLIPRF